MPPRFVVRSNMQRRHFGRSLAALTLLLSIVSTGWAQNTTLTPTSPAPATGQAADPSSNYIRVQDSEDGDHVILQVATRSFAPTDGKGPTVHLVGAVHIGDKAYYKEVQKF